MQQVCNKCTTQLLQGFSCTKTFMWYTCYIIISMNTEKLYMYCVNFTFSKLYLTPIPKIARLNNVMMGKEQA